MGSAAVAQPELYRAIERLEVHDHACLIYRTPAEQFEFVIPFIRYGLECGDRCVYIADQNTESAVLDRLRRGGIDVAAAVQVGRLVLTDPRETYLRGGSFDPDRMIAHLKEAVAGAKADGCRALRATGEMTWALGEVPGVERLMEYESLLNRFFPEHDCLGVCQYNRSRFPDEVIREVILTHPLVICGGVVAENPYCIPPELYRSPGSTELEVDQMLAELADRARTGSALRRSESRYRRLFEAAKDGILIVAAETGTILDANAALTELVGRRREQLVGKTLAEAGFGEDIAAEQSTFAELQEEASVRYADLPLKTADGRELIVELVSNLYQVDRQSLIQCNIRDVTERKQAERELERRVRETTALSALSRKVSASLTWDEVVQAALEEMMRAVAPDLAVLFRKEGDDLILQGSRAARSELVHRDVPIHRVGQCLCGLAAQEQQALYARNILTDRRCTWEECKQAGLKSLAALPLQSGQTVLGVLALAMAERERDFGEQAAFLETLANGIAIGLHNALLFEEARRGGVAVGRANEKLRAEIAERLRAEETLQITTDRLDLIARTTAAVVGSTPLVDQAQAMAQQVLAAFGADACAIRVLEENDLVLLASAGLPLNGFHERLPATWGIGGKILANGHPVFVADVHEDPMLETIAHAVPNAYQFTSYAGAPLLLDGKVIGVLGIYKQEEMRDFNRSGLEHLQILADNITVAIANDRLHRETTSQRDRLQAEVIERRRTEERLRESEERLRLALTASDQGMYDLDVPSGECVVSPEYAHMLGYDPAEFHETRGGWVERLHPDDRESAVAALGEYLAGERAEYRVEFRQRTKGGDWKWIQSVGRVVSRLADGQPLRMLGTHTDITERKRAEQNIQEWTRRYELVVAASGQVAYEYDVATGAIVWGHTIEKVLGYRPDEFDLRYQKWVELLHPDDRENTLLHLDSAMRDCSFWDAEYRLQHRGGHYVWLRDRGFFLPDATGKAVRQLGLVEDITERKRAEEELRESEERFRTLLYESPDAHIIGEINESCETRFVDCNQAALDMLRMDSREQLLGTEAATLSPERQPDGRLSREKIAVMVAEAVARGSLRFEWVHCRANGEAFPVEILLTAFREHGKTYLHSVWRDITERKRAEAALRTSEANLREAQEIARMGRWEMDLTSNHLECSDGVSTLFGIDRGDLATSYEAFLEFVHPDDRALVDRAYRESIENKKPYEIEHRLLLKDGRIRWVNEIGRTEYDDTGRALRSIGTIQDVTERKKAEEALQESERRYQEIFEGSRDGYVLIGVDGTFVHANQAYCDMLGYSLEELKALPNFLAITPASWQEWERREIWENRLLRRGYSGIYEKEYIRKDGRVFPVELQGHIVLDSRGHPQYLWGIARDITERKQAEKALRESEEHLRQAQKMEAVGRLAGGVAHDLNNTLTAIFGHLDLARARLPAGHEVQTELDGLEHAARQAAGVTRGLLALSGRTSPMKQAVSVGRLLSETIRMLRHMLPAGIEMTTDAPADARLSVLADPTQIEQVLVNLALNARDAMPEGGQLRIELAEAEEPGAEPGSAPARLARISVQDTGTGIAPELQSRIFEPFFTTKARGQGTGLGLAIVHGIVRDHGGRIEVDSAPGRGTTMTVLLPTVAPTGPEPGAAEEAAVSPGRHAAVLLAEDQGPVQRVISTGLAAVGYEVVEAADGEELQQRFHEAADRLRLLIFDLDLPKRSGLACLRDIRAAGCQTPAILITGKIEAGMEDRLDEHTTLLHKPFRVRELAELAGRMVAWGGPAGPVHNP